MTTLDQLVCGPGAPSPSVWIPAAAPPVPALARPASGVTRVLVTGDSDPQRVRWALTQVWRRAGRPLAVVHGRVEDSATAWRASEWASEWASEHHLAGVRAETARGQPVDVVLAFGGGWTLALARGAGLEVVDGNRVGEFRG